MSNHTPSFKHDDRCEIVVQHWDGEGSNPCRCRDRRIAVLEAALAEAQREYEGPMSEEIRALTRERTEDQAAIQLLNQAIKMYDNGGFVGDNIDRWFNQFVFHRAAIARASQETA